MGKLIFSLIVLSGLVVACGTNALGESCDNIGESNGECDDGSVCSRDTNGEKRCLKICHSVTECPSGTRCGDLERTTLDGCKKN